MPGAPILVVRPGAPSSYLACQANAGDFFSGSPHGVNPLHAIPTFLVELCKTSCKAGKLICILYFFVTLAAGYYTITPPDYPCQCHASVCHNSVISFLICGERTIPLCAAM